MTSTSTNLPYLLERWSRRSQGSSMTSHSNRKFYLLKRYTLAKNLSLSCFSCLSNSNGVLRGAFALLVPWSVADDGRWRQGWKWFFVSSVAYCLFFGWSVTNSWNTFSILRCETVMVVLGSLRAVVVMFGLLGAVRPLLALCYCMTVKLSVLYFTLS